MNLNDIRHNIDAIDADLVRLLEQRMILVAQVAASKAETKKPLFDPKREQKVLDNVASQINNPDFTSTILASFSDIMKHSREYQKEKINQ